MRPTRGNLSAEYSLTPLRSLYWIIARTSKDTCGGGALGGGSQLTAEATTLITRYREFCSESDQALKALFEKYFEEE